MLHRVSIRQLTPARAAATAAVALVVSSWSRLTRPCQCPCPYLASR